MRITKIFFLLALCFAPAWAQTPQSAELYKNDISPGYRGYALRVDAATYEMAPAETRVDVLATFDLRLKGRDARHIVATLLQDVVVLERFNAEGENYLLLSLSPVEAQYLMLASSWDYKIITRAKGDGRLYPLEFVSFDSLLGGAK
jgi:hypothetical protein